MPRPKKYQTDQERREARRQSQRKYYSSHREAISARQAKRDRSKRPAIEVGQKET